MAEKGKLHAIFLSCGQLNQNENYERKLQMYSCTNKNKKLQ